MTTVQSGQVKTGVKEEKTGRNPKPSITLSHMEMHQPLASFGCWEMKLWEGSSTIYMSDKCYLGTKLQFQLLPFSTAVGNFG